MEQKINFNILMSLKESCLRKITIILWSKPNILESLRAYNVNEQVKDDVSKLELPPLLKEQMKNLVTPIGLQIRLWRRYLKKCLTIPDGNFDIRFLKHLYWTNLGTLDYQKMAENLIRHKMFDCVKMYQLSCLLCLDDCIPSLWRMLPPESKRDFYPNTGTVFYRQSELPLQFCWPHIIQGKLGKLNSMIKIYIGICSTFYQYAFENSAYEGNRAATEYFFLKLTDDEKEVSLFRAAKAAVRHRLDDFHSFEEEKTFPEEKLFETVFYLLQLLSSEQQMEILKTYPYHIFMCLLDWPLHNHLLDSLGLLCWEFLLEIDNNWLFLRVAEKISIHNHLLKLFQDLFQISSSNSRKRFVDRECELGAFRDVFRNQESETIKAIFRNVECVDRKRLVASVHTFEVFYELISRGKSEFVDLCLQEATLSKEDKKGLKETYFVFFKNIEGEISCRKERFWESFLCLFD